MRWAPLRRSRASDHNALGKGGESRERRLPFFPLVELARRGRSGERGRGKKEGKRKKDREPAISDHGGD